MVELVEKDECCGCQACFNACPTGAIVMEPDEEGFYYPIIAESHCVQCGRCIKACPILNIPAKNKYKDVFAAYAKEKNERMSSSSGGVFSVLAKVVLESSGVVCGAVYQKDNSVHHVLINDVNQLCDLKGTKYIQSSIDNAYSAVLESLCEGRNVLFSGTPCQIAGLRSFLGKDWDNLLCVDLICHGVPSPAVWKEYLHEMSPMNPVDKVEFRCKRENEKKTFIRFKFKDGQQIEEQQNKNLFMKGFLQNYYVRPSCFRCHFKGMKRCSDITIGDFWSIHEFHAAFADQYGNSAVIVHSEKGRYWLEKSMHSLCLEAATEKQVLVWNECLIDSVKKTDKREQFYSRWHKEPITDIILSLMESEKKQATKEFFFDMKKLVRKILR